MTGNRFYYKAGARGTRDACDPRGGASVPLAIGRMRMANPIKYAIISRAVPNIAGSNRRGLLDPSFRAWRSELLYVTAYMGNQR